MKGRGEGSRGGSSSKTHLLVRPSSSALTSPPSADVVDLDDSSTSKTDPHSSAALPELEEDDAAGWSESVPSRGG